MHVAVNSHALPVHEKNGIASLLCIFESTICIDILMQISFYTFLLLLYWQCVLE